MRFFANHDLIDEYELWIHPVIAGKGELLTLATSELGPTGRGEIDLATAAEDALDANRATIDKRHIKVEAALAIPDDLDISVVGPRRHTGDPHRAERSHLPTTN